MADVQLAADHATLAPPQGPTPRPRRRLAIAVLVALACAVLVLTWDIGPTPGSRGFWIIVDLRVEAVATIVLVALCQALATVSFQTATANRILTPSIMGFESLYVLMQTTVVFFFGAQTLAETDGVAKVLLQSALMVAFATGLYAWLFGGRFSNLHVTLLVGVVLGVGFGSLSTFMQRLLTPSEFDVLAARLFGNIGNSNAAYLPWGFTIAGVCAWLLYRRRHRLDVLALGRESAINLGLSYRREVLALLVLSAALISISTTMVGPMTFFGFVVAILSYQLAGSAEHRHVLPFSVAFGTAVLLVGYFLLHHVLDSVSMLTVIIEFGGGLFFVVYLLRKGSL